MTKDRERLGIDQLVLSQRRNVSLFEQRQCSFRIYEDFGRTLSLLHVINRLSKLGIGFAIEHYGVDTERFQILDMLKPDYIKIDGELMHTLMTDKTMQASVSAIVKAAGERHIKTVAERVENANAMAVLFQLGIDFMQGHYVHEPEVVLEDSDSGVTNTLDELTAAQAN